MNHHIIKKSYLDLSMLESEIQQRLKRGKTRLMVAHSLLFILAVSFILFVL